MRTLLTAAGLLAVLASGCQMHGAGAEDDPILKMQTAPGATFEFPNQAGTKSKVVVEKIENRLTAKPASVVLTLKNTGSPIEDATFEVEFGYPAPEESFAPYIPHFEPQIIETMDGGKSVTVTVTAASPPTDGAPRFTRVVLLTGDTVRGLAARQDDQRAVLRGTGGLSGKVEVVSLDADYTSPNTPPRLVFTIENVDSVAPDKPLGNVFFKVAFFKQGKPIEIAQRSFRKFRAAEKPLGKRGERLTIDCGIADLDPEILAKLPGSVPVLSLKQ